MTSQCRISAEQRAVLLTQDRAKRVYIAGPMTGIEDFNFPAFNAMADYMRSGGWHVENPADHGVVHGAEWADYLRYDVGRLATCEAIMLLPGWSKSKGANLEVTIARQLGMPIMLAEGAESAEQPHPDPIAWMVGTAFWWTKEEAERDAAETGLPIVGLGPMGGVAPAQQHQGEPVWFMTEGGLSVLHAKAKAMSDQQGLDTSSYSVPLFTHADPAEVESLKSDKQAFAQNAVDLRAEVERLRLERRRMDQALSACANERDALRAKLAERDALLREASEWIKTNSFHGTDAIGLWERIDLTTGSQA